MSNQVKESQQAEGYAHIVINKEGKVLITDIWNKSKGLEIEHEDFSEQVINSLPEDTWNKEVLVVFSYEWEEGGGPPWDPCEGEDVFNVLHYSVLRDTPQKFMEDELTEAIEFVNSNPNRKVNISKEGKVITAPSDIIRLLHEYEEFFKTEYRYPVKETETEEDLLFSF